MVRAVIGTSDDLEAGNTYGVFLFELALIVLFTVLFTVLIFCCTGMLSLSDAFPSNKKSLTVAISTPMSVSKKLSMNKKSIIINVNKKYINYVLYKSQ